MTTMGNVATFDMMMMIRGVTNIFPRSSEFTSFACLAIYQLSINDTHLRISIYSELGENKVSIS